MESFLRMGCSVFIALTFAACGSDSSSSPENTPEISSEAEKNSSPQEALSSSEEIPESSSSYVELSTIINEDSTIIDSRDSNIYKVMKLGDQIWMAENMKYSPEGTTCEPGIAGECLYTWTEAMNLDSIYNRKWYGIRDTTGYQGLCPSGWHVPSIKEGQAMIEALKENTPTIFDNEFFCYSIVQEDKTTFVDSEYVYDDYCERLGVSGQSNGFNMHLNAYYKNGLWLIEEEDNPFRCEIAAIIYFWETIFDIDDYPDTYKTNKYNLRCVMNKTVVE